MSYIKLIDDEVIEVMPNSVKFNILDPPAFRGNEL